MESKLASYRRMVGLLTICQGINFLFPLLTLPLLVRTLGTAVFGSYSVLFGLIALTQVLTEFGYAIHGVRVVAASQNEEDAREQFNIIIFAKLFLCMVAFPIYLLAINLYSDSTITSSAAAAAYAFILGSSINPTWYFIARKKFVAYTLASATWKLISFAGLYLCVSNPEDLTAAVAINSIGNLALGATAMGIARLSFSRVPTASSTINSDAMHMARKILLSLRETRHLFVANVGISLYTSINVVLIGFVGGSEPAGQFSAAERIVKAAQLLLASLSTAALPAIAGTDGEAERSKLQTKLLATQVLIFAPTALMMALGAPLALEMLYGQVDPVPLAVLRILSVNIVLGGISSALNSQVLAAAGKYKTISHIVLIGGFSNLILAYALASTYGAIGCAVAVVSTEFAVLLLTWYAGNSKQNFRASGQ